MKCLTIVKLFCLSCIVAFEATAQNTAVLTVHVLDPGGAAIPGAQVTLNHALSNLTKQTQASLDGIATLTNIPLQSYQLEVSHTGFGTVRRGHLYCGVHCTAVF